MGLSGWGRLIEGNRNKFSIVPSSPCDKRCCSYAAAVIILRCPRSGFILYMTSLRSCFTRQSRSWNLISLYHAKCSQCNLFQPLPVRIIRWLACYTHWFCKRRASV